MADENIENSDQTSCDYEIIKEETNKSTGKKRKLNKEEKKNLKVRFTEKY